VGLYVENVIYESELRYNFQKAEWDRFRISWADFRNANRGKKGKIVRPYDLIRFPEDDRVPEYHEIDIDAIKRRFGSKLKKKRG
jgi:hypothetical protein